MRRQPYDRLRAVIGKAERGEPLAAPTPRPPRRVTVNIGEIEPRTPNPVPRRTRELSLGEKAAATLINADDPFGSQVPVSDFTMRELRTAQQAGTRWLKREGHRHMRLSYRRRDEGAVWTLRQKPDTTTQSPAPAANDPRASAPVEDAGPSW